jgi:uncharacterized membrane protein YcaP (DUF421 family)
MEMYINIAIKLFVGSIAIFILMRIIGKKAISEVTPFDLLYVIILGALIEESIYDNQVNILHVLFGIVLWGLMVYIVEKILEKTEFLSSKIQGEPSILIDKGQLNVKELRRNHFDMEQLRVMLRQEQCYSIDDAYYAILEVSGGLTVITKETMTIPSLLLIEHGNIKEKTLRGMNKDEEWLKAELAKMGEKNLENIIYCEWNVSKEELVFDTYDNTIDEIIYIDD